MILSKKIAGCLLARIISDVYKRQEGGPLIIQLVAPVSKQRIPKILEHARGFVYCVSSMGVTGQEGTFHRDVLEYLSQVKSV